HQIGRWSSKLVGNLHLNLNHSSIAKKPVKLLCFFAISITRLPLLPHSQTHPFPLQLISCGAKGGKNALYL
ncbi:hypothetical protein, partial [Escherichia coli]|uniref:hypothetical protein n=2 Tax=Escherichia coli TaxID=562 RepID=UPI003B01C031